MPDLGSRIDHIFLSPGVTVTACGVDDTNDGGWYPSDHMPKFAVLDLGVGGDSATRWPLRPGAPLSCRTRRGSVSF